MQMKLGGGGANQSNWSEQSGKREIKWPDLSNESCRSTCIKELRCDELHFGAALSGVVAFCV